jgi:membrane protein implicated in regulation of membrane protease activity
VFSIVTFLVFRAKVYQMLRGDLPDRGDGVVGECGTIESAIEPGAMGSMELRGSTWRARNAGERVLPQGSRARVESTSGLTVNVVPEDG